MPGTNFKRSAKAYRQNLQRLADRPFAFVKAQLAMGNYSLSYVSKLLEKSEDEHIIKWTAASLYLGATISVRD
jgi:hypothetical protein